MAFRTSAQEQSEQAAAHRDPVLRSFDGNEFSLPAVTIDSGDVVSVNLHDILPKAAPQLIGSYGSVVFRYRTAVKRALYAAVMVHDSGHPISFHLDAFGKSDEFQAGSREGIWWLPNETATDYLVLTNSGNNPLNAMLELTSADAKSFRQPVIIPPRQTTRLSIRSLVQKAGLAGHYGGIRIGLGKAMGDLDSTHFLFDETAGFSAMMKMFDYDPQALLSEHSWGHVKEWTTRAPHARLDYA
jgi:hypothetical protein